MTEPSFFYKEQQKKGMVIHILGRETKGVVLMIIKAIYERTMWRDEKTGETAFLVKLDTSMCRTSCSEVCSFCDKESCVMGTDGEMIGIPMLRVRDRVGMLPCQGVLPPYAGKMPIVMEGSVKDGKRGLRFYMDDVRESTEELFMAEEFLMKGGCPGIGPALGLRIYEKFGDVFLMRSHPDLAAEFISVKGVSRAAAEALAEKIRKITDARESLSYFIRRGCGYRVASDFLEGKEDPIGDIIRDPYHSGRESGLPFLFCDQVARENGGAFYDPERLRWLLRETMEAEVAGGHCFLDFKEFCTRVRIYSGRTPFLKQLGNALILAAAGTDSYFHFEESAGGVRIWKKKLFQAEEDIVRNISRLVRSARKCDKAESEVASVIARMGLNPDPAQERAVVEILRTGGVHVLTGGPGTGKTMTVSLLISAYESVRPGSRIAMCAPSGRAAARMREASGHEALTIHRTLDYRVSSDGPSYRTESDPVDADLIVIDEMSMTGTELTSLLLAALRSGTTVVFCGDPNQLPSVEPGNVLRDTILSGIVPVHVLAKVFRQNSDSLIRENCCRVHKHRTELLTDSSFTIIETGSSKEALEETLKMTGNSGVMALFTNKASIAGTKMYNRLAQERMGRDPKRQPSVLYDGTRFFVGDPIIMLCNNYDKGYFNGDVGEVEEIGDGVVSVLLEGSGGKKHSVELKKHELGDMDLAYGITIHKSQGSEYAEAVIVLSDKPSGMLDSHILFTAISRAKEKVTVISVNGSLAKCIRTIKPFTSRNSALHEKLMRGRFGITA